MKSFEHHVLVCTQDKPDGVPACGASGGKPLLEAVRASVGAAGLMDRTLVTGCGCLGLCERGPNVLIHPQGRWYASVRADEVAAIVNAELVEGKAVEGRADPDADTIRTEVNAHRAKVRMILGARAKAGVLPDEVTALAGGFRASRAFLTALELDVFTTVGAGATAEAIAASLGADVRGTTALLRSLVSLGLLERDGTLFRNSAVAAAHLVVGAPHDARAALMHSAHLWHRWSGLTDSVKTGSPAARGERSERQLGAFIAAMHKNAALRAPVVVGALDLSAVKTVLDVGGGSGAYSIALTRANPALRATVFDVPAVLPLTKSYAEAANVADRIDLVGGSFHTDPLGSDFDLALLFAICHMNSPEENVALITKIAAALRSGGRLVIQDFLLDSDGGGHATSTLFALNMLVNTVGGNSYRTQDYVTWMEAAGFGAIQHVSLPGPTGLIVGTKR